MMPAKLQLDVLRTLQSSARHGGTQTLKNLQLSPSASHKDRIVFCLPILPGTFSRPSSKVLQHLCLRFTQVAPYFIIQLFDLPSETCAKTWLPCLPLVESNTANCFSSSSNGQVPSIIFSVSESRSLLFTLKYFKYPTGSPMIWLDVFQVFFVFLIIFAAFPHS
ncbi:ADM_collapsed_G0032020.mRNA.1.CDS.1 [Saccharomyces cerevisiae]|nr:ADM_collapsed_G0032020.mRNA.1.CDS.1 [Saccharomyces cerevisiae]